MSGSADSPDTSIFIKPSWLCLIFDEHCSEQEWTIIGLNIRGLSPFPTKIEQGKGARASACSGNENLHLLVGLGKIDFVKSKKIVRNNYLLIVYGQKSNVHAVNRVYNGPCRQRKVNEFRGFTMPEHCTFALAALYNALHNGPLGTIESGYCPLQKCLRKKVPPS